MGEREGKKMSVSKNMSEKLAEDFAENYMEKIFYFCLKKTGNSHEAEDLTQNISLNIIAALNKGIIPSSFSAWIWKIARNRYSVWAAYKHRHNEYVTGYDVGDYEIADESENVLDDMINGEKLSLLRRELAFIKSDFRSIMVAYYIENRSVREIARSLSIPEDTVKQRLHRARKKMKEGMNMAREFGKKSYNPENISFISTGPQPSGLPFSAVERKIPKNILLQASNNPSTAEELSMELGIALPYMEEEVELLYNATLLEKDGNRYITNFFILDKECQLDIYNLLRAGSKERSRMINEFIGDELHNIRSLNIAGEHIDDNTVKWYLTLSTVDYFTHEAFGGENYAPSKRANGETWGFVGYEDVSLPESTIIGHNGHGNEKIMLWTYKIKDYNLWDQCGEPNYYESLFLGECVINGRKTSSFSDREKEIWKNIDGKYAHSDDDGKIIPDILVFDNESRHKIWEMLKKHRNYDLILGNFQDAKDGIKKILEKYNHKVLRGHIPFNTHMEMIYMRMMSVHDLVENGSLKLPADPSKSRLGMYLILQ